MSDRTIFERIAHDFKYHAPDADKRIAHESWRHHCKRLALALAQMIPESRERSLALTKLEECLFWGNAAIARNPTRATDGGTDKGVHQGK